MVEMEKALLANNADLAQWKVKFAQDQERLQSYRLGVSSREDQLSSLEMKLAQKEMELQRVRDELELERQQVTLEMETLGSGRTRLRTDWEQLSTEREKLVSQNHEVSRQARDLAERLEHTIEELQLERRARESDRTRLREFETRVVTGEDSVLSMQRQIDLERRKLQDRQRTLARKELEIRGATKSLEANRDGLNSQLSLLTDKIERLLSERSKLDQRRNDLLQSAHAGDEEGLKARLELAFEELEYEQQARELERQQLAAMVSNFGRLREQLNREQQKLLLTLKQLSNDELTGDELEALDPDNLAATDDKAVLELRVEKIEAEVEAVRHEREALAQQRADTQHKLVELERETLHPGETADEDEGQTQDEAPGPKSKKKSQKEEPHPIPVEELAEAAREAGKDESEQVAAFRNLLAGVFGIKKDENATPPEMSLGSLVEEVVPGTARDATTPAVDDDSAHAVEPEVVVTTTATNESDVEPRSPAEQEAEARRVKSRSLAQRMAITSLREVANMSARTAVAEHSKRKLKNKMWRDGVFAVIAFVMGGVYLLGDFAAAISWKTYGWIALVVGVVAIIEMLRTYIRWRRTNSLKKAVAAKSASLDERVDRFAHSEESEAHRPPRPAYSQHPREMFDDTMNDARRTEEANNDAAL